MAADAQNAFGRPACCMTSFAVRRLLIPVGTGKLRFVRELYHIGWRPFRTNWQPFATRISITCLSNVAAIQAGMRTPSVRSAMRLICTDSLIP
jgi:hypothetical protein